MSTTAHPRRTETTGPDRPSPATETDAGAPGTALPRALTLVGGLALLATPLLIVGGIVTSPPQETRAMADYITSLARDPGRSSLSASLLHYGWVAMALGLVLATSLVRGRKGRLLTVVGGLAGGFTAVQMSALLLNDWTLVALGTQLPMTDAVRVAESLMLDGDLGSTIWWQSGKLAILAPALLYVGLARAGVISWWLVPLSLFPMVAPYLAMGLVGGASEQLVGGNALGLVVGALVGLTCYAPTVVTGLRLVARSRLAG